MDDNGLPVAGLGISHRAVLDVIQDAVIVAASDGTVAYANPAVERLLGWSSDDLRGQSLQVLMPPELRERHQSAFNAYIRTGEGRIIGHSIRVPALHRDGSELAIELTLASTDTGEGERLVVASLRDVAERVEEAEARFRLLVEGTDAVFWEAHADSQTFTFVAGRALEAIGYARNEWLRPGFWAETLVHPTDRARMVATRNAAVASGRDQRVEYRVRAADGGTRWVRDQAQIVVEAGRVVSLRGAMVDVTDEKQVQRRREVQLVATRSLSESKSVERAVPEILRALSVHLDWDFAALWVVQGDRLVCSRTHVASPLVGAFDTASSAATLARGEGLPGSVWASGEPDWRSDVQASPGFIRLLAAVQSRLHAAYAVPLIVEGRVVGVIELYSGEVRDLDENVAGAVEAIAAQIGQLLERQRAEERIRLQHALLRSQSEATLDGILVLSAEGEVLLHNQRLLELTDLPATVLEGSDLSVFGDWVSRSAEDPNALARLADDLASHPDEPFQCELPLADGRVYDIHTAPLVVEGDPAGRAWHIRDVTEQRRAADEQRVLATTLQESLLPPRLPDIPGIELGHEYVPAGGGTVVGGDFYDVFDTGNGWAAVMGDVCGKGAAAAAITALVRYSVRTAAMQSEDPADLLRIVNDAVLAHDTADRFCTLAYVRFRPLPDGSVSLRVSLAGHPQPMAVRESGDVEPLGVYGPPLGLLPVVEHRTVDAHLAPGESVVLFTDGVTEARRGVDQFGTSRLQAALSMAVRADAKELADSVVRAATTFQEGFQRDDIAVLVVRALER